MRGCKLESEKTIKKKGRGSTDFKLLSDENIIIVRWFDNKPVNLISSYVAVEPIDSVRRYDQREKTYIDVPRPSIVKVYNTYMGGADKLDMMCAFYKGQIKSRRWYIYIWLHSVTVALVSSWLLYRRDQMIHSNSKTMKLRDFQQQVATSLRKIATKRRPSFTNFSRKCKREHKQPTVPVDARKDGVGHIPIWDNKRNRCGFCKDNKFSCVKCGKCNVWLCFNKERACYGDYHE